MCKNIENLIFLLIGWMLGLVGSIVFDLYQRRKRKGDFMAVVLTELRALRYKMALLSFRMRAYTGNLEDVFLRWFQPIADEYNGPDKDPMAIDLFREFSSMSPEERKAYYASFRQPNSFPKPVAYNMPFIDAGISNLALCPTDFQLRILEIKEQLHFYNEQVKFILGQFEKTFDPSIIGANRKAILTNLDNGIEKLINRAKWIADNIKELDKIYG